MLPSVTKTKRKDSPGLSPAGGWRAILSALAWLPTPSPIQQITMAIASLCVCVSCSTSLVLLCVLATVLMVQY